MGGEQAAERVLKNCRFTFLWMWDWKRNKRKGSKRKKKTKRIKSNRSSKKGRKIFSFAVGNNLTPWLSQSLQVQDWTTQNKLFFCRRTMSNFPHGKDWPMQLEMVFYYLYRPMSNYYTAKKEKSLENFI